MSDAPDTVTCDCGTEMELTQSGTQRTVPLVGGEVEYRLFACPQCGEAARYERSDGEWTRVGV